MVSRRQVCYTAKLNRNSCNIIGEGRVSADRPTPSLIFTNFGGTIYSIGVTTPGKIYGGGANVGVYFSRQSPKDGKMGSKMNTLWKKN